MIHLIDNRTDEVLSVIPKDGNIIEAVHEQDADSKSETLDFTVFGEYEGLMERNRALIQDEDGDYREFIIENVEEVNDEMSVFSNGSYLEDLNNERPIAPGGKEQFTTKQWVDYALTGTGWDAGTVEYNSFRTISWTGYNTPYELLVSIANRFDMSLRFRVEVEHNRVVKRCVDLVKVNHLFNGKEIARGKDLDVFKRTVNTEDMATALVALGPQPQDETEERIVEMIYDDEANEQYNKPGRYLWNIYEPQTEDQNMTRDRLKSLARTELNKRKAPLVDYEIDAINLGQLYGHEIIRLYDKVRVKDEDMNRYAEANTKKITRNLLDETDRVFVFGDIVEFEREDLRAEFNNIVWRLRQRLDEAVRNADNIQKDIIEEIEKEYERKIPKTPTPPDNPKEGDFWFDTSNPKVGILYRYENGKWVKASVSEASEIGAITREEALYDSITNMYQTLTVRHTELQNEVANIMTNEYFEDGELQDILNTRLDTVNNIFRSIKNALDGMTIDTATIGALIDIQALIVDYRDAVHYLSIAIGQAQQAIDEYFKLLQSQYSEEKFNDALDEIANKFEGISNSDGQLIGDLKIVQDLENTKTDLQKQLNEAEDRITDAETDLKEHGDRLDVKDVEVSNIEGELTSKASQSELDSVSGTVSTHDTRISQNATDISSKADASVVDTINNTVSEHGTKISQNATQILSKANQSLVDTLNDTVANHGTSITQNAEEIEKRLTKEEFESTEVGGRNLIPKSKKMEIINDWGTWGNETVMRDSTSTGLESFVWVDSRKGSNSGATSPILTTDLEAGEEYRLIFTATYFRNTDPDMSYIYLLTEGSSSNQSITHSKPGNLISRKKIGTNPFSDVWRYTVKVIPEFSGKARVLLGTLNFDNPTGFYLKEPMLVQGDKAVATWTPAPEDTEAQVTKWSNITNETAEGLETTINRVAKTESGLSTAEANILENAEAIKQSVKDVTYQTDMSGVISRLDSADASRETLADSIKDRVTLTEYRNMKVGGVNLVRSTEINEINKDKITNWNADITIDGRGGRDFFLVNTGKSRVPSSFGAQFSKTSGEYFEVTAGKEYILSFEAYTSLTAENEMSYTYLMRTDGGNQGSLKLDEIIDVSTDELPNLRRYVFKFKAWWTTQQGYVLIGTRPTGAWRDVAESKWFRIRNIQLEEGNVLTPYEKAPKDTDERLNTHETEISQNGKDIALRATKTEMNATDKTLSRSMAEIIASSVDGISLRYDRNGVISDFTVDSGGASLNTRKFTINDGDVTIKDGKTTIKTAFINDLAADDGFIDNLTSRNAFISKVRVMDVDLDKAKVASNGTVNYMKMDSDSLISHGEFSRTWAGETDVALLNLGINKGRMMISNENTGYNLYITEKGLSTTMAGATSDYSAGTIEFHSQRYNETSRGVTVHSTYGAVALISDYSTIYTESEYTNNIESRTSSVYIRPMKNSRVGTNDFRFWVKDNASVNETDGVITLQASGGAYGSGIRFRKSAGTSIVYATNNNGDMGTGLFHADFFLGTGIQATGDNLYLMANAEIRATANSGYNNGSPYYRDIRAARVYSDSVWSHQFTDYWVRTNGELKVTNHSSTSGWKDIRFASAQMYGGFQNHSGNNVYMGVGTQELRITDNNQYNGGSPNYKDIRFQNWRAMSTERLKKDIEPWNMSVLDIFKEELQLYKFKLKSEADSEYAPFHHGVIIEREVPSEWVHQEGFDGNEVMWFNTKGIQELAFGQDDLNGKYDILKTKHEALKSEHEQLKSDFEELREYVMEMRGKSNGKQKRRD